MDFGKIEIFIYGPYKSNNIVRPTVIANLKYN